MKSIQSIFGSEICFLLISIVLPLILPCTFCNEKQREKLFPKLIRSWEKRRTFLWKFHLQCYHSLAYIALRNQILTVFLWHWPEMKAIKSKTQSCAWIEGIVVPSSSIDGWSDVGAVCGRNRQKTFCHRPNATCIATTGQIDTFHKTWSRQVFSTSREVVCLCIDKS